ncbi:hydrogenase nickel incorporation protein HypB [candidate division GN15 bacterium]|nr:hydrogenase nickel incorporation protein HypB [candidate division GN15 bacterium]
MDIIVARDILKVNDQLAQANRAKLDAAGLTAVNVMSSPGAGKTTLLERLATELKGKLRFGVIEGDLATANDAQRLDNLGVPTVQINTGRGCHLDANMVQMALENIDLTALDLLFVENVGNLVCPSSYKLGERCRLVLLSVPEGDDKVAKYPPMFTDVDALVITKADLLPYVDFDVERVKRDFAALSPKARTFQISARTGDGMPALGEWLLGMRGSK